MGFLLFLYEILFSQNIHKMCLSEVHKTAEKIKKTGSVLSVEVIDLCSFSSSRGSKAGDPHLRRCLHSRDSFCTLSDLGSLGPDD